LNFDLPTNLPSETARVPPLPPRWLTQRGADDDDDEDDDSEPNRETGTDPPPTEPSALGRESVYVFGETGAVDFSNPMARR
jgi:hypothetical protein